MSEIDENFGRYLDSLTEPVEPEWVIGWVARRRRRRAMRVTGAALALAAVTGVVGYQLHPDPAEQVQFGANGGSSTTAAPTTSTTSSSTTSTSTTSTTRPSGGSRVTSPPPPPTAPPGQPTPPTTIPEIPADPHLPSYPYALPGDATAATAFSSSTLTVGVPVDVTVTVVNTRDYGVAITANGFGYGVWLAMDAGEPGLIHIPFAAFAAPRNDTYLELAPHLTVTATVTWTPTVSGSGTARFIVERLYSAHEVNVAQAPTPFTIAPAPGSP